MYLNMELEITYVSDSIQALAGYSVDEYMALPTLDAVVEQSQEAAIKKMFADYLALEASGKPFMRYRIYLPASIAQGWSRPGRCCFYR